MINNSCKKIAILLLITASVSCGTVFKTRKVVDNSDKVAFVTVEQVQNSPLKSSANDKRKEIAIQDHKPKIIAEFEIVKPIVTEPVLVESYEPYKIVFTVSESANVRSTKTDPFAKTNPIIIPMSRLEQEFKFPCSGKVISKYGYRGNSMHTGTDIKCTPNEPIYTILPGVVRMSKPYSGYGNVIVIHHYNGMESIYSHLSKNQVAVNQVVEAGEQIGLAGRTGRATTEHLHLELRFRGDHFDPTMLIDFDTKKLKQDTLYAYLTNRVQVFNKPQDISKLAPVAESVPLVSDDLQEDESLNATKVEPTAKTEPKKEVSKTPEPKPKAKTPATITHKVAKGDNLGRIARKYGVTVAQIMKLNKMKNPDQISAGQVLKIK